MANVNTIIQAPLVNPVISPQSPDSDMEVNDDEIVNKLIDTIKEFFGYQQLHYVKKFIETYMNPKYPFLQVDVAAFEQSLIGGCEIEDLNFINPLMRSNFITIEEGKVTCKTLSTYVFDKLLIALKQL